jgi:ABC-type dipeptide/oligopeptide/nickel transport system permease component
LESGSHSPTVLQFLLRRLSYAVFSFFVITLVLYGSVMLVPAEARAQLYIPRGRGRISENFIPVMIRDHHLDDPFPIQYGYWLRSLLAGSWGYSPTLQDDVLHALLQRTPATLELALYSLLIFIPLGLWSGLRAGWRPGNASDVAFRGAAFVGLSMPPVILGMLLITVFYAQLHWFPPGRLGTLLSLQIAKEGFHAYTGMMTIDSILNSRLDVFLDAAKHLVLPVLTLSLYHWATLGRITRALIIGERRKEYLLAAKGRGVAEGKLIWRHALRNVLAPSLTGIALSAASILTGVYVVEIIFDLNGISKVIVAATTSQPDAPAVLGFSVYTVIIIITLMLILDVLQVLAEVYLSMAELDRCIPGLAVPLGCHCRADDLGGR